MWYKSVHVGELNVSFLGLGNNGVHLLIASRLAKKKKKIRMRYTVVAMALKHSFCEPSFIASHREVSTVFYHIVYIFYILDVLKQSLLVIHTRRTDRDLT